MNERQQPIQKTVENAHLKGNYLHLYRNVVRHTMVEIHTGHVDGEGRRERLQQARDRLNKLASELYPDRQVVRDKLLLAGITDDYTPEELEEMASKNLQEIRDPRERLLSRVAKYIVEEKAKNKNCNE